MSFWIFKCDPKRYGPSERLENSNPTITWLVTRYKKEITPGDTVFLMETGKDRSIRAVMHVDVGPQEIGESESEQAYWKERDTGTRCRIRGTITHRVNLPVEDLEAIEGLQNLSIFHGVQRGTNFRVTDAEGQTLLELIERSNAA